jgi:hypothetical protein
MKLKSLFLLSNLFLLQIMQSKNSSKIPHNHPSTKLSKLIPLHIFKTILPRYFTTFPLPLIIKKNYLANPKGTFNVVDRKSSIYKIG